MTHRKFALDYRSCTTDELRQFIRQRTGNLRRDVGRAKCIQKLRDLDAAQTFRFLDQIPEVRNAVYELVLCHNDEAQQARDVKHVVQKRSYKSRRAALESSVASPALLQVNKQMHLETCGLLTANSTATYKLSCRSALKPAEVPRITLFLRQLSSPSEDPHHNLALMQTESDRLLRHDSQHGSLEAVKFVLMSDYKHNQEKVARVVAYSMSLLSQVQLQAMPKLQLVGFEADHEAMLQHWLSR